MKFHAAMKEVEKYLPSISVSRDELDAVNAHIATIKLQLKLQNPSNGVLRESRNAVVEILKNALGGAIGTGMASAVAALASIVI